MTVLNPSPNPIPNPNPIPIPLPLPIPEVRFYWIPARRLRALPLTRKIVQSSRASAPSDL